MSLARAGIHDTEHFAEQELDELLCRPELSSGVELYELICELHRHGLTPFRARPGAVQTERELEMFRLRAVEGLTLARIAERLDLSPERVRQLLRLHFGLAGKPPAAKRRPRQPRR
ncbi:MAG: sigma factor-like helix-turn-helix DNA-binding protein [Solirubrobacteraceae bacterium]